MSIQLVLGGSGAGKSYYMYQELIKNSLSHPEKKYFIVVPEQFTMQTQRDIVTMHPMHGTMNIDIVSFNRLAYRIFEELRIKPKQVLEDVGKSMLIRKLAGEQKEKLTVFGNAMDKQGMVEQIKSMLSEFYQYGITGEMLAKKIAKMDENNMLACKLKDMSVIYEAFEQYMKDNYIVAEQLLDLLGAVIGESKLLADSTIYFDGFTGFTPVQYQLIERLLPVAKKLVFTVTLDVRELAKETVKEHELFYLSKETIRKLTYLAKKTNVSIEEHVLFDDMAEKRFANTKEIAHLEKNLFRFPYEKWKETTKDIKIFALRNPRQEILFVARKIKSMVMSGEYEYKDIAVVTGDFEHAIHHFEEIMPKLSIPYFIDATESIKNNPYLETLRAVLDMVAQDFTYESVFRYLKSGMSDVKEDEVERLENYVLKKGIRGFSRWSKRISDQELDGIRRKFIKEVKQLRNDLQKKDGTVKDFVEGLYQFGIRIGVEDKLAAEAEAFERKNQLVQARAYSQIYEKVMYLFDKQVELLGEEKMSLSDFLHVMDAGLGTITLGVIPPSLDQILIGDIERTRLNHVKVLFFIGVNDGIIPSAGTGSGILTDYDREKLMEYEMELAPTKKADAYTQQFYLYLNMTKPQEKLFVTYRKLGDDNQALHPSYLIHRLESIFPNAAFFDESEMTDSLEQIYMPKDSAAYFIEQLKKYLEKQALAEDDLESLKSLLAIYKNEYSDLFEMMKDGIFYENTYDQLSTEIAQLLYGMEMENSISRLEKYAGCAYAFFLRYGLGIQERELFQVDTANIGTILHGAMEHFFHAMKEEKRDFKTLSDEERDGLMEAFVEQAANEENDAVFESSSRNQYLLKTLTRIGKRAAKTLHIQLLQGKMEPGFFEMKFQKEHNLACTNLLLNHHVKMHLNGIVDRVDLYEDAEHVYVKLIDYKSGEKDIDMTKLYYGTQIQLVVYMNVVVEFLQKQYPQKKVVPAGMFYYHLADPILQVEGKDDTEIEAERLKTLKLTGLVNQEQDCISLMDQAPYQVLPISGLKDGSLRKTSSVATTEQFEQIGAFVQNKMQELGNQMVEGDISIAPVKYGGHSPCEYCEYSGVCRFDTGAGKNQYRNMKKITKQDMWEILQEGKQGQDGVDERTEKNN